MAKFIYRMQSILDIKVKMEDQAKTEFATAKMHLDEEEERLQYLKDRKTGYEQSGRELRRDELKVFEIIENKEAIDRMEEFILIQMDNVRKAERALDEARARLTEAMQESKTHEKLREKAFDEFVHEENAREAKEVDELTSYTHSRRS